jgi:hypothetical protein
MKGQALDPDEVARFRQEHAAHPRRVYVGPVGKDLPMLAVNWTPDATARPGFWARLGRWIKRSW